jgi:hypothetical protein
VETAKDFWVAVGDDPAVLPQSRRLLLLDGFDEVMIERRAGLVRAISELARQAPQTGVVLASRPTKDLGGINGARWFLQSPSDANLLAWTCDRAANTATYARRWDETLLHVNSCFRERPDVFQALGNPLLLSYAVRVLKKWSVTTCRDTDLLESCLTYLVDQWDDEKSVTRPRTRWTSSSARGIFQWLGSLCYHALTDRLTEFTGDQVAVWFRSTSDKAPVDDDLCAAAECTGVLESTSGNKWRIVHRTIQEYLAAKYVVESSRDATEYLRKSLDEPWVSGVLRFACSITNDATPLLKLVLEHSASDRHRKMSTLADMVAQQIRAPRDVIEKSCDDVVGSLEDYFADWRVATNEVVSNAFPEPKWRLAARSNRPKKPAHAGSGKQVLQTIKAVHRARLSPAKQPLVNRLTKSSNDVVRNLGDSLMFDGYMEGQSDESALFAATVSEL